jgi:hypothetical protein
MLYLDYVSATPSLLGRGSWCCIVESDFAVLDAEEIVEGVEVGYLRLDS